MSDAESQTATPPRRALSAEFQWQKSRLIGARMPEFRVTLVKGYGPAGAHSLFLPSPVSKQSMRFVNGAPVITVETPAFDDDLARIRDLAIVSSRLDATEMLRFFAPRTFALYSAAAIKKVYDVTDEDLTFLHSADGWIEPVLIHAMGGQESTEALARIWARKKSVEPISDGEIKPIATIEPDDISSETDALPELIEELEDAYLG